MSSHERHSYHTLGNYSEPSEKEIVRDRLTSIAKGAEIISRNVRALPFKPGFKPGALWALEDSEKVLEETLQRVREAMAEYHRKEIAV